MLIISIPEKFTNEIGYTFEILLNEFLGVDYELIFSNEIIDFKIEYNSNFIIIKNQFFSKFNETVGYLNVNNLPKNIKSLNNKKLNISNLPIIFGEPIIEVNENEIILFSDIIASAFFMLTRWEEYVNPNRDKYNRFPATESIAFKNDFLDRPIVNEYVELLWNMLVNLGFKGKRKERKFQMVLTHDVDVPKMWWSTKSFIKTILATLIKRRDFKEVVHFIKFRIKNKDPFDTFDYLMTTSEDNNLKSHFFFMSGGTSDKDNFYKIEHPYIIKLMKNISNRGHYIGFHPSFNAYNDKKQYKKELDLLNKHSPQPIKTGREHYLRFEIPTTWQIWEDNNMQWDSTMTYHDRSGFRCGVCYEFPVFNILTRKQLKLKEKPLIVMEGNFITYQNKTPTQMYDDIENLIKKIKKYNGEFVFLWHNSAFNSGKIKEYQYLYKKIIENHA